MKPKWHWSNSPNRDEILKRIAEKKRGKPNPHLGNPNPFKGKKLPWVGHCKPHTEEAKEKMSINASIRFGIKNNKWKGDDVGNVALHSWVKRKLGRPTKCEFCGFESESPFRIHWANKSHEYKRDITDWLRLCVPCHKKYDLDFIKNKA